jgi:hypothetical protein
MPSFDESNWRVETRWTGSPPTPHGVWKAFHAHGVSEWFRDRLEDRTAGCALLQSGIAQGLREIGHSEGELLDRAREALGRAIRPSTLARLLEADVEPSSWKIAFTNLVSGRFTEIAFKNAYAEPLDLVGVELYEDVAARSFLDFRLTADDPPDGFALSMNVKNAGRQMRQAQQFFGLTPEDTIPIATYKAFGAAAAPIPPLLYAFLVDWTLLDRLRKTYWEDVLTEEERVVFRLLTSFKGFSRDLEDDFITATVDGRLAQLRRGVGYSEDAELPFRVVSAARCHAIFYEQHQRSPYVYVRRMNTDPNVHISVAAETLAFGDVIKNHLSTPRDRATLLEGLRRTKPMSIPDPPL